jgi:hypothetical protein
VGYEAAVRQHQRRHVDEWLMLSPGFANHGELAPEVLSLKRTTL